MNIISNHFRDLLKFPSRGKSPQPTTNCPPQRCPRLRSCTYSKMLVNSRLPAPITISCPQSELVVQGQNFHFNRLGLPFADQLDRSRLSKHVAAKILSNTSVRIACPIFTYQPDYLAKGPAGVAPWDTVLHGSQVAIWAPHSMFLVLENRCCHCDHSATPYSEGFKDAGRLVKNIDGHELWVVARKWSCKGGIHYTVAGKQESNLSGTTNGGDYRRVQENLPR